MKFLLVVEFAVFVVVAEGTTEYTALTSLTLYVIKFIVYSSLSDKERCPTSLEK